MRQDEWRLLSFVLGCGCKVCDDTCSCEMQIIRVARLGHLRGSAIALRPEVTVLDIRGRVQKVRIYHITELFFPISSRNMDALKGVVD